MLIASDTLWYAQTNTYVVAPDAGGPAVIIDAPPEPEAILALVARYDLKPVALLLTHGHVDHTGGAGVIVERTGASAYVHPDDDFLTLHPFEQLRILFGMTPEGDFAPPRRFERLADGAILRLVGLEIEVLHTPGHTPGHCCFLLQDTLFSGDHLFAGSIGRTDLPGGDMETLLESMKVKILPLSDETTVYPGHGPATTMRAERRSNPFLRNLR
ncbi:putative metallo-hydrolase [bacterium BMS3Abin02]|nr:putative metallo-hydrolase [bacterium BMS3Abin02]GBE21048.1 putative metallo-hydrolase [bacterium BMS3Bbin01]HDH24733.1 MBL fold metallo-hydrolase [Actinomycetota bacterium]HDK44861.1 MBL fold metallo-hydrolase [Actinomycetota bacterium]